MPTDHRPQPQQTSTTPGGARAGREPAVKGWHSSEPRFAASRDATRTSKELQMQKITMPLNPMQACFKHRWGSSPPISTLSRAWALAFICNASWRYTLSEDHICRFSVVSRCSWSMWKILLELKHLLHSCGVRQVWCVLHGSTWEGRKEGQKLQLTYPQSLRPAWTTCLLLNKYKKRGSSWQNVPITLVFLNVCHFFFKDHDYWDKSDNIQMLQQGQKWGQLQSLQTMTPTQQRKPSVKKLWWRLWKAHIREEVRMGTK